MRKTIKLSLTLILACVMLFAVAMVASAAEPTDSGDISRTEADNVKWEYYADEGKLVVFGTGRTLDFAQEDTPPYHKYLANIKTIEIEDGVTLIGNRVFKNLTNVTTVYIPDSVTLLGNSAFYGCKSLEDLYLGTGIERIYSDCFEAVGRKSSPKNYFQIHIKDLTAWCNITFDSSYSNPLSVATTQNSNGVKDGGLYLNGERIDDLVIPYGVTEIKKFAFRYCYTLDSVTFPDSVTKISDFAFDYCIFIKHIYLGNNPITYGNSAFRNLTRLRGVHINNTNAWVNSTFSVHPSHLPIANQKLESAAAIKYTQVYMDDGVVFKTYTSTASSDRKAIVIPEGVESINAKMFYNRRNIKAVTIPESVKTIAGVTSSFPSFNDGPFSNCTNLKTIYGTSASLASTLASRWDKTYTELTVVPATSLENNLVDQTLSIGAEPLQLTATVLPTNATYKSVNWYSSDPTVVAVVGGSVTAIAPGTAVITAKTPDGNTATQASCTITVPAIPVTNITLDATAADLSAGHKLTLVPTIAPVNASNKNIIWTSSNNAIATVADGIVTPVANGEATITATTADGSFEASCVVTVTGFVVVPDTVAVTGVELDIEAASLKVDETVQLEAIVAPADATNKDVVWSTNAPDVATVNNGLVTAVGVGNAIITVTTVDGEFTDTCTIAVLPKVVPATSVTLNETEIELEIDGTATLVATILPVDSTETEVVWTSDAEGVATVDGGVVTAVGAGTATIKATVGEVYAECIVTVKAPEVFVAPSYITLVGQDDNGTLVLNLAPGQTYEPVIEFWTEDDEVASAVELDWYVSDSEAVSVENGVITANAVATGVTIEILALDADQYPDVYGYIEIEVANILVSEITLNKTELSMALEGINQTFQLEATVAPADATDATYTWASSDDTVATVDENGLVTAVGEGTAEITATANDEGGVVATCIVKVAAGSETPIDPWNN